MPRPRRPRALARALTLWFARNRRDLPWRRARDPYRVWVSEIMLQQTTVSVVVPYYRRFLRRFPTIARLAAAPIDDVLAAWSGLGYYRRARHLHAAARLVVERHGGRLSDDPAALRALPGIGRYTAGAIASIAFGRAEPILDGNVARVLARHLGERRDPRLPRVAARLWDEAAALVAAAVRPGDLNEALMELGALVCLPAAPDCRRCPIVRTCAAHARGVQASIPPARRAAAPRAMTRTVALIESGGRLLVRRRAATGLMDGLFELPAVEPDGRGGHRLEGGARVTLLETAGSVRHSITWRRLTVTVARARLRAQPRRGDHRWVTPAEALRLPASSLLAKSLRAAGALAAPRREV